MIVLDTNVVSEMVRLRPNARVTHWLRAQPAASVFTTAITEAEILYGVSLLPNGRRRNSLLNAVRLIFDEDMAGRMLPFDADAAPHYADIAAQRRRDGQPISAFDAQI
ncbi:MAG: type II toxin-antitoxin system VapC family toxin, partial [Caulobacterales bacterium]